MQIERAKSPTALNKIDRKLAKREAEILARKRRVERMTPAERQRYDAWLRAHQPGSKGARAAARAQREQAEWLRQLIDGAKPSGEPPTEVDVFG